MACEVQQGEWLFHPPQLLADALTNPGHDVAFLHTPLHDIETILWMIIWSLVRRPMGHRLYIELWQEKLYRHVFLESSTKAVFIKDGDRMNKTYKLLFVGAASHSSIVPVLALIVELVIIIKRYHEICQLDIRETGKVNHHAWTDNRALTEIVRSLSRVELHEDIQLAHEDDRSRKRRTASMITFRQSKRFKLCYS